MSLQTLGPSEFEAPPALVSGVVDEVPADLDVVRYWDLAATEKTEFNDFDLTRE